jgi:hypothetical protein
MRCENKERHTLLAARSWSSTLLAAQRGGRNDAAGQIDYSRITYTLLGDVSTLIEVNFSPLSRRYTLEELGHCQNATIMHITTSSLDISS